MIIKIKISKLMKLKVIFLSKKFLVDLISNNYDKISKKTGIKNLYQTVKSRRKQNKGYAFVTFSTSEQAKTLYLLGIGGLQIKNQYLDVLPKFGITHEHFDSELLVQNAKNNADLIEKKNNIKQAEEKLIDFEKTWSKNLDSKHAEYDNVLNAYKDFYTDPFKKHDRYNPLTKLEEDEIKHRIQEQQKQGNIDNTWLLESSKIEKLRKNREERVTKKYLEWELLRKGVVPESTLEKIKDVETYNNPLNSLVDSFFSDKITSRIEHPLNNPKNKKGRINKLLDSKGFIEKYIGMEQLQKHSAAFEDDNQELGVYKELKELKDRFPKEKFIDDPSQSNKLIDEINAKYVRMLNAENNDNSRVKDELLERISTIPPTSNKINTIALERTDLLEQDEEIRQRITMANFFTSKVDLDDVTKESFIDFDENEEKTNMFDEAERLKEKFRLNKLIPEEPPKLKEPIKYKQDTEVIDDEDTSFASFLKRRRALLNKPKTEGETDAKNKSQFDPNNIDIKDLKEKQEEGIEESIKNKFDSNFSELKILEKNNKKNISNSFTNTIYQFIEHESINNKIKLGNTYSKVIDLELKKKKFIEEIEKNFKLEYETLPDFRKYVLDLKNGKIDDLINERDSISNYRYKDSEDSDLSSYREQIAILFSGKLNNETFKRVFAEYQESVKRKTEDWISEEDIKNISHLCLNKIGINTSEEQNLDKIIEERIPYINDEEYLDSVIVNMNQNKINSNIYNQSNDIYEEEYYFNPNNGSSLEEHLASISELKNVKVSIKSDEEGRIIIKRVFKTNYKYDLDDVLNFDMETQKAEIINKIKRNDFKKEIEAKTEFYSKFIKFYNETGSNLFKLYYSKYLELVESLSSKIDGVLAINFKIINPKFSDLKNLVNKLFVMSPESLKNINNSITSLLIAIKELDKTKFIDNEVNALSLYTKNILTDKEVKLLIEIIKESNTNLKPLVSLSEISKHAFIQDVLLLSIIAKIKEATTEEEFILVLGLLRILPKDFKNDLTNTNNIKRALWIKYKQFILNEYSINLKKEKEIDQVNIIEDALELRRMVRGDYEKSLKIDVNKEISEFTLKIQDYYFDLTNLCKISFLNFFNLAGKNLNICDIVSDDELFVEEITEQIEKRLNNLKNEKIYEKKDLVKGN